MKTVALVIILAFMNMACLAGGAWYIVSLRSDLARAKNRIAILTEQEKLNSKAEMAARAARQVENEKAKERERIMRNVLDDNCDWSGIELPDDVARLLQYGEAGNSGLCPSGNTP